MEASGTKRGSKFNLPLFCDTGAGLDICSQNTAKRMGLKIHFDPKIPQNIYDVSRNNIQMFGFVVVYIHHEEYTKPMKVTVAKNLGRDG